MPRKLHENLEKQARKAGLTGEAKDRYIYSAIKKAEEARKRKR